MLRNKTFAPEVCSLISNWLDMREQALGANLLHESVSGANSLVCTEICLSWNDVSSLPIKLAYFFHPTSSLAPISSLVMSFVSTCWGACFRSKLPLRTCKSLKNNTCNQTNNRTCIIGTLFQLQARRRRKRQINLKLERLLAYTRPLITRRRIPPKVI